MAITPSNTTFIDKKAPHFSLLDTISGNVFTLDDITGKKGTLILFICNHCPYVRLIEKELAKLSQDYANNGIGIVAISSNDIENYPEDAPDKMKTNAERLGYGFPYLFDEKQEVAKAYNAACTPDIFLFDANLICVYHGQFDDARPGNNLPATGKDLRNAMNLLIDGKKVPKDGQKPSVGCNIKWR